MLKAVEQSFTLSSACAYQETGCHQEHVSFTMRSRWKKLAKIHIFVTVLGWTI
jgi:hypothetical protein